VPTDPGPGQELPRGGARSVRYTLHSRRPDGPREMVVRIPGVVGMVLGTVAGNGEEVPDDA